MTLPLAGRLTVLAGRQLALEIPICRAARVLVLVLVVEVAPMAPWRVELRWGAGPALAMGSQIVPAASQWLVGQRIRARAHLAVIRKTLAEVCSQPWVADHPVATVVLSL